MNIDLEVNIPKNVYLSLSLHFFPDDEADFRILSELSSGHANPNHSAAEASKAPWILKKAIHYITFFNSNQMQKKSLTSAELNKTKWQKNKKRNQPKTWGFFLKKIIICTVYDNIEGITQILQGMDDSRDFNGMTKRG